MTLHLRKLAVGVEEVAEFERWIRTRLEQARERAEPPVIRHVTRHVPKRAAELLDGGSLYWVVKGSIRVRQRLLALEPVEDGDVVRCALVLDGTLVPTLPRPHRPFQGWRYLRPEDAPQDAIPTSSSAKMPEALVIELEKLGLL